MISPFIPKNNANLIIISGQVEDKYLKDLKEDGLNIIKTIPHPFLNEKIAFHPDMVMCQVGENKVVVDPDVYDYYHEKLGIYNIEVIRGSTSLKADYPYDIAYNAIINGGYGFHNTKFTDGVLLNRAIDANIKWITVNQGYTKCSVLIVNEDSIITADKKIAMKWNQLGKESLLIQPGHIDLPGFKHGFIGGASGNLSKDKLIIAGNLKNHPNGKEILEFINDKKIGIIDISYEKLYDIGTILAFYVHIDDNKC